MIEELRQNRKGNLKFDLNYVKVSDIKEQFYCEQQVELRKIHGEIENERTRLGTDAHQSLLADSVSIKNEEALRRIFTSRRGTIIREMSLAAKHNGVAIIGSLDCVIFAKGFPLLLLDFKFKRNVRIYDPELLQAGLYSYLLNRMGFDTSLLRFGIVAADSMLRGSKELVKIHNDIIKKYYDHDYVDTMIDGKRVVIALRKFEMPSVTKDLDWALPFWLMQREPVPTKVRAKCNVCDFKNTCQFSLSHP